jgi:RHS repeat-associated protein
MRNQPLRPILRVLACLAVLGWLAVGCGAAAAQATPNGIMKLPNGIFRLPNGASRSVTMLSGAMLSGARRTGASAASGNVIEVSLGVQTYLMAWAEYDPSTCTEISSGAWTLNSSPAYGTVSYGTVTAPAPCGGTFTYGAIYYTLTSTTATSDTFSATWNSPDGMFSDPETFDLVTFDMAKNCGCNDNGSEGNPISAATGNKFQTETDFVGAPNTGLEFRRYYNSQSTVAPGEFGINWSSTYQRSIISLSGGSIVQAVHADGRVDTFMLNSGAYVGDPDVMDRLNRVPATGTQTGWQLIKADDSIETYTLAGLLSTITTRAGLVTTLTYNNNNRLVTVTGPFGHTLTFGTSGGRVVQMTVPDGGTYSYAYSASGNLASVTYPDGSQRQYLYEIASLPNALTGIIDEDGNRFATWTYDFGGRVVLSQHAGGVELTTLTYNADGSTSVTDARGNVHSYAFTIQFGMVKQTAVTGVPVQSAGGRAFTYDANGFIASSTDWDGNVTTYTHDTRGDETSRTMASGTPQALAITTTWLSNFHLPSQISEGNRTFSYTYDANGNVLTKTITTAGAAAPGVNGGAITKTLTPQGTWRYTNKSPGQGQPAASSGTGTTSTWTYTYNSAGQVLTATDPNGKVTGYAYDAKGDVTSITNALGQVTHFTSYDADGRPLTVQDPNGLVTTLTYNFRGQVTSKTEAQWVTIYTYDAVGQLIQLTRPDGSFLAFSYDAAHRLVGFTDALGNRTVYTLDATSNRIGEQMLGTTGVRTYGGQNYGVMGAIIQARSYSYDAVNRLIQEIGAVGQTTSYSYDTNGNLTQVADPLGHVTSAAFDALNRVIKTTDANAGMTAYGYDNESRLAGVTDPRGLTTSYVHDGLDDLTSINSPDSGVTAKTYDAAGNLVTSTDARGDITTYTYDALNRVTKATFADSTSIVYQYDQGANGIGHLTAMTDAGGTTTWVYDIHGRVTSKQQTTGAVTLTTSKTYNAVTGQLASMTYPSGSTTFYSYDATGRVSAITYQPSGGTTSSLLSQIAYQPFGGPAASWGLGNGGTYRRTFDQDGRIAGLALPTGGTIALTYDAANRVTGITETGLPAKSFGYDALDRVTSYSGAAAQTYAYDADGNRTGFTAPSVALTYSYGAASNRLLGISGSETDSFTYDANGNMLTHNAPAADYSYTYNARNRRTQALLGANATTDVINGLGQRTVQTVVSSELFFYDEAGHLTGSYNGNGSVIAETVWLDDLPVAVLEPSGPFYIAPDHLGAPHQITDGSINAVWLWDHDPFGNGTPSGTFSDNFRFPGQFYDQNAKLHYNYYRDYDPNTGRYIESDPIGLRSGINTYAYALNNPAARTDPLGLWGIGIGPITISPTPPFISIDIPKSVMGDSAELPQVIIQRNAEIQAYNTLRDQIQKNPKCPTWERDALKKLGDDINKLTQKINDLDAKMPSPGNWNIQNGWIDKPGSLGQGGQAPPMTGFTPN